jgi:MYXO-CTERM domain-containing protein
MSASADGTIAVGYMESAQGDEAILWRQASGVVQLKDYLVGHGVVGLDGWNLETATEISPDGQAFCGWGLNPSGETAPWLAEGLAADVNLDWRVDIFDANVISSNWGKSGSGDANGDGVVNIFDMNMVSTAWGRAGTFSITMSVPPPPPDTAEVAPEPASIGIWALLAGMALALRCRRRRPG